MVLESLAASCIGWPCPACVKVPCAWGLGSELAPFSFPHFHKCKVTTFFVRLQILPSDLMAFCHRSCSNSAELMQASFCSHQIATLGRFSARIRRIDVFNIEHGQAWNETYFPCPESVISGPRRLRFVATMPQCHFATLSTFEIALTIYYKLLYIIIYNNSNYYPPPTLYTCHHLIVAKWQSGKVAD